MDAKICLQKLQYVGVLAFATTDEQGGPQVRNISAIHYEPDAIYFFTARGKDFCRELLADGRVQVLGYTRYKEMIRPRLQDHHDDAQLPLHAAGAARGQFADR